MRRASGVSAWEDGAIDVYPLGLGRPFLLRCRGFVCDGLERDVVTACRLVLENALPGHVLATAGGAPEFLRVALVSHPSEEVPAHVVVVVVVGLVAVLPALDELVCKRIDEQPTDRHVPFVLPGTA